jgi:Tfp pilus assembly protein PilE
MNKTIDRRGTTMVELTVAVAVMAVVFAAIMPLFAGVRNSAESRWANLEMVQTARVLNEQLCRHLAAAKRVTAVSTDTSDQGSIQFEAADGVFYRCALGAAGAVEFGPVGDASALAGPVDYLRFVCYDGNDLASPTSTPETVRLVTWEAGLRSAGTLTRDKIVRGACYLRVAADTGIGAGPGIVYDFAGTHPGEDSFAFADGGKHSGPPEENLPAEPFKMAQYDAVKTQDGQCHALDVAREADYAQLRLAFRVAADPAALTVQWTGRAVNAHESRTDGAALYIWNYAAATYEMMQQSADTEAAITLGGSRTRDVKNYLGGADGRTVVVLVASNDKMTGQRANTLYTDYVRVDIAAFSGGGAVAP